MKDQTETALIPVADSEIKDLFGSPRLEQILTQIETECRSHVADVSTAAGRSDIKSLAHKIARSKTTLDKAGLDLTKDMRDKIAAINGDRNIVKARLDDLKNEIRKPLDEWEEAEESRKAKHRANLEAFHHDRTGWKQPSSEIGKVIEDVTAITVDETWEEFEAMAETAKASALQKYRADFEMAKKREEQEAEAERLKAEKEAEAQRLREENEALQKRLAEAEAKARAAEKVEEKAPETPQEAQGEVGGDETSEKTDSAISGGAETSEPTGSITVPGVVTKTEVDQLQQSSQSRSQILNDIREALASIPRNAIPEAIVDGKVPHVHVQY